MELKGSGNLRYRVVLSALTGSPLTVTHIRHKDDYPGMQNSEVNFLELVSKITNGTQVTINQTGTELRFVPGIITNNPSLDTISHNCDKHRGLAYYLEPVILIALFGKHSLNLQLRGVSNLPNDLSLDYIQLVVVPLLKSIGIDNVNLKISSRGENALVTLKVKPLRKIETPIQLTDTGKIKRVRGIAYSSRINVQMANRVAYAAKGQLLHFLPDVWIQTDHQKSETPLLGVTLVAETTTKSLLSGEFLRGEESNFEYLESEVPEDLGTLSVLSLLEELTQGASIDTGVQCLVLLLMAFSASQGSVRCARLTPQAIDLMRLIKQVLKVEFKFEDLPNPGEDEVEEDQYLEEPLRENLPRNVILSCTGIAYENMARIAF